jgi:hypothetical protein
MARPGLRLAAEQLDAPSLCAMSIVDCENHHNCPCFFDSIFRPTKKNGAGISCGTAWPARRAAHQRAG